MHSSPPKTFPIIQCTGEKYTLFNDEKIGNGAYADVYKGRTASGQLVAVKAACKSVEIKAMKGEIEILEKLKEAPNIVRIIGSTHTRMAPGSVTPETITFAMEYAKSSLEAEMRRPENLKGLSANVLIDLVVDLSMALTALHTLNIAHRDIKHMNILLFPGTPTRGRRSCHLFKLCDMGCSKELLEIGKNEMRTLVGTPNMLHPYLAQELVDPLMERKLHNWKTKSPYTREQCDLWPLGCTLFYCATGRLPFEHDRNNKRIYNEAVKELMKNPKSIAMHIKTKDGNSYEYEGILELPARFTRYPRWLVVTMTELLRNFFHSPSIDFYSKVAGALRTAKRRIFVSIDQMQILDHTDMSEVLPSIPSISECLSYPPNTDLLLLSNTSSKYIDSQQKSLENLPDETYLVVPQRSEVEIRKIMARNIDYREAEDMTDRRLAEVRIKKCYDGLSMLTETDEYVELFDKVATILETQFSLVEELNQFEPVQTASRFAVYVDMASVPVMLFDETNPQTKSISEHCIQKAKQAREELELHAKTAMNIEAIARQLAKDSGRLRIDDVDLPEIREEIESYFFMDKPTILSTKVYSQELVTKCYEKRNHVMAQIFKSPDRIQKCKLKMAMDLAASWNKLKNDSQRLQNNIAECVDLLERPFQEMRDVVNKCLLEKGHSRNSMQKSMHYLAPEFRENQHRMKRTTRSCQKLIDELNQEIEQLGFVRMGDTLVRRDEGNGMEEEEEEEGTLKRSEEEEEKKVEEEEKEMRQLPILKRSTEACSSEITSSTDTSFESTPPSSPSNDGSNYFQAVFHYFSKNQPSKPT